MLGGDPRTGDPNHYILSSLIDEFYLAYNKFFLDITERYGIEF